MGKLIDLTGQRFGRWTVLYRAENRKGPDGRTLVHWRCRCDCGNERDVYGPRLRKGESLSCGCYNRDHQAELHRTHGKRGTRLYNVWCSMKQRCDDPNCKAFKDYGGRGITVCDEWNKSFDVFCEWACSNGYDEAAVRGECTLDRIDVNGNYEPSNCRWIAQEVQNINRRNNVRITLQGETKTLSEWCEALNMPYSTVHFRIRYLGWDAEKALSTPV